MRNQDYTMADRYWAVTIMFTRKLSFRDNGQCRMLEEMLGAALAGPRDLFVSDMGAGRRECIRTARIEESPFEMKLIIELRPFRGEFPDIRGMQRMKDMARAAGAELSMSADAVEDSYQIIRLEGAREPMAALASRLGDGQCMLEWLMTPPDCLGEAARENWVMENRGTHCEAEMTASGHGSSRAWIEFEFPGMELPEKAIAAIAAECGPLSMERTTISASGPAMDDAQIDAGGAVRWTMN